MVYLPLYNDKKRHVYEVVRVDSIGLENARLEIRSGRGFAPDAPIRVVDRKHAGIDEQDGMFGIKLTFGGTGTLLERGYITSHGYNERSRDAIPNLPINHSLNYNGQDGWVMTTKIDPSKARRELLTRDGPTIGFDF